MSAIFEFACQSGHEFQLWSDDARLCPTCGSEFLKRIFKTAPMIGTGKPARVDALVRNELEARGITNIQGGGREGDTEKVSYKSTPEQLAADKVIRDFPQLKQTPLQEIDRAVKQRWSTLGVKGIIKSGLHNTPEQAVVKGAILNAGRNDRLLTNRVIRKDPENLTIAGKKV